MTGRDSFCALPTFWAVSRNTSTTAARDLTILKDSVTYAVLLCAPLPVFSERSRNTNTIKTTTRNPSFVNDSITYAAFLYQATVEAAFVNRITKGVALRTSRIG